MYALQRLPLVEYDGVSDANAFDIVYLAPVAAMGAKISEERYSYIGEIPTGHQVIARAAGFNTPNIGGSRLHGQQEINEIQGEPPNNLLALETVQGHVGEDIISQSLVLDGLSGFDGVVSFAGKQRTLPIMYTGADTYTNLPVATQSILGGEADDAITSALVVYLRAHPKSRHGRSRGSETRVSRRVAAR